MSFCDATASTARSRPWTHTLSSTARWTGTNSALPKSLTGSVSRASPFSSSTSLVLILKLFLVVFYLFHHLNIVVALRRRCDHHPGHVAILVIMPVVISTNTAVDE